MSHMCDTYKLSVRKRTGDTDVCHLYLFEEDDYDGYDDDGGDDDGWMIQRAWVSQMCDTYKLYARKATSDTDVCHLCQKSYK